MSYAKVEQHIDDNHSHHGDSVVKELKDIARRNATPISWAELIYAIDITSTHWNKYVNMETLQEVAEHYGKEWKSRHGKVWMAIAVGPELIYQIARAFQSKKSDNRR